MKITPLKRPNRWSVIVMIMIGCIIIAVLTLVLLNYFGVFDEQSDFPPNKDSIEIKETITEPCEWAYAWREPIALLKINEQSNESKDIRINDNGDVLCCIKCNCEILFFGDKLREYNFRYEPFSGEIYIPENYKEEFSPGTTVLTDLSVVWGAEQFYLPCLDKQNRPEYLGFYEEKLVIDQNYPDSPGFYILKKVDQEIDNIKYVYKEKPEWGDILYDRKLESGMSVEEVRDYLKSIWPAAEKCLESYYALQTD